MKKCLIIFISFYTFQITNAQDYSLYFKNLKNIIQLNEFKSDEFKNKNIKCLDENLSSVVNNYFDSINSIKFDSINPGRINHFTAICEIKYSKNGEMVNFITSNFTGPDQDFIEEYKNKTTQILQSLEEIFKSKYGKVVPALNYKNQSVESIIPLIITVRIVNGNILLKYRNIPDTNLADFNDYSNTKELKMFYDSVYQKIEKTFDENFQKIAKNNNIKNCVAHIYFEVSENGKIENIKNVQNGNKIFEKFLKEQFLKDLDKIQNIVVIAKLLDGEKVKKTYLMSFQFGFKNKKQ